MNATEQLIQRLADGAFHSGEALGAELGISRAAVWKRLSKLSDLGLELQAVHGRGYRLACPLELLDWQWIKEGLSGDARALLRELQVHQQLDSTNSYLNLRADQGADSGLVCMTEFQHAGRGRRGRAWVSPYGSNLYFSLLWRTELGPASLSSLSLAVGVAMVQALRELGVEGLSLKWPNDLLLHGHKLAGILLEVAGEAEGPSRVVIGVGVNYGMSSRNAEAIDQPWADLRQAVPELGRNRLASLLIGALLQAVRQYELEGFSAFKSQWHAFDHYRDQEVCLRYGERMINGVASGVDEGGLLLLQEADGLKRYAAGEVSLRGQQ